MFDQNCPFHPPYNNRNAFYNSPTGLYRPTMDSSTFSQANQPYSPVNRVNLDMDFDQLMYVQEYYPTQNYSMGHGSAHGSAPVDDDDFPVEEMSPVKAKHDFTLEHCYNILKDHQASGGFNLNNEADESEEEIKKRAMGRDRAKAKKKSSVSSREGSSSFVDLIADKFLNMRKEK
ncbi:hypothetical protein Tco_0435393 [Tanacetum coccineum]